MGKQIGFEERDAVETPGGVGDLVDELSLGGGGGLVLIEKLLDVALVGFRVLGGQDRGLGSESVAQSVKRRPLLAGLGTRAGGVLGVGAVSGGAAGEPIFDGIRCRCCWSLGCCCDMCISVTGITRPTVQSTGGPTLFVGAEAERAD